MGWVMWIAIVLAVVYFFLVICFFRSLRVAIAIIETAADFFADTKRVVLVPIFYFFVGLVIFMVWVAAAVNVGSIGKITPQAISIQDRNVEWSDMTYYKMYFMVFGLFWILNFVIACNEFAVICAAATWYFSNKETPDDDGIPGDSDVSSGFWWTFRYHFGSLAFGSLLCAIVTTIRVVFEYVGEKVAGASGNNQFTTCLLASVRCCLDCFDRFLRYINRNAYIYMAISSESFCTSAINSFVLILKNAMKFGFVETISEVFMFLAKFCIAVSTTFCGFMLLGIMVNEEEPINNPFIPVAAIFGFSYLVASVFISIFDIGANTILQCYLIDLDVAKQNNLEPTHIPPTLTNFL